MNARSIERRLMNNRLRGLWGRRAYLTVRIPLSAIPEPLPEFTPPGTPVELGEAWFSEPMGDEFLLTTIDLHSSSAEPEAEDQVVLSWRDGSLWEWVTVTRMVSQHDPNDDSKPLNLGERVDVDAFSAKPLVEAYMARRRWIERWGNGKAFLPDPKDPYYFNDDGTESYYLRDAFGEPWAHPEAPEAMRMLHNAGTHAKTHYTEFTEINGVGYLEITYSVKWFHRERRKGFCSGIRRALDRARKDGFPAQLV